MAQFDVHRNATAAFPPYLVVLSHDIVGSLATVVVAPLVPIGEVDGRPVPKLCPKFTIEGEALALMSTLLAGVPPTVLGVRVASLEQCRGDIIGALDFLFTGI